jgi:hypothetical protein
VLPELRARGGRFERWADEAGGGSPPLELLRHGSELLDAGEPERNVDAYAGRDCEDWRRLCDGLGGEEVAAEALVLAAVRASLAERAPVDASLVELLEEHELDPSRVLALALEPGDVWSVVDAAAATAFADSSRFLEDALPLVTAAHLRRLDALIERLRRQLPLPGAPRATRALEAACAADEQERVRAALLLLVPATVELLAA